MPILELSVSFETYLLSNGVILMPLIVGIVLVLVLVLVLEAIVLETSLEFIDVSYFGAVNFLSQNTPDAVFY